MASPTGHHGTQQQKIYLLDLPLEILQLIAWHLDVATFYTSLLTCKKFMDAAKARRIILRHLQNLPGLRLGLEQMSTLQLWDLFRKRAAESLCGAGVLADIKSFASTHCGVRSSPEGSSRLGEQPKRKYRCDAGVNRYKVSKPAFSFALPAQVAMADDLGIIRVFRLDDRGIRLTSELRPQPLNLGDPCHMAVLKMAFSSNEHLAVLYQPLEQTEVPEPSPFGQQTKPAPQVIVVYRHRRSPSGDISYSAEEHETIEFPPPIGTEFVSLAVAPNGNVCVGWRGHKVLDRTGFFLFASSSKKPPEGSDSYIISIRDPTAERDSSEDQLIFHVKFIKGGRGLNFYEAGNPIHSWFISSLGGPEAETISWQSRRNICFVEVDEQMETFEIGMPFRGFHFAIVGRGTAFCRYSYLAIGITKTATGVNAFILMNEYDVHTRICQHSVDLDGAGNRVEWAVVAFLAGWRLGSSSLGTVMAVSPGGNRIAAATWDRLLIWTLDCDLLRQGELQHYFPVRDYNATKGFGRLRPTKLSTEGIGVIYSLRWASETSLFASTELGLVQWDMGILSTGKRHTLSVDQEA